ncbi:hypothetical protein SRA_06991 [Streptococcus ratti FA-1 = DSM 20564]|uniref:Uncharacterized protein n=1 Tax=Streptococcus ratti FA-1 = DSM 20564 TaxID=699248 RepID=A0ABP2R123_STRRT|nr:hypothetical protein SRA_06991 [Streptococcus ratti FA-1 = DSM 20564]QEY06216.1 hypothetical protein FY406_00295 [Streptococcus ratti]
MVFQMLINCDTLRFVKEKFKDKLRNYSYTIVILAIGILKLFFFINLLKSLVLYGSEAFLFRLKFDSSGIKLICALYVPD